MAVLLIALAITAASGVYTARNLEFATSQRSLIAQDNRFMQLLDKADKFSELDAFVVAIENRDQAQSIAFTDELARRLRADRKHYEQIFDGVDPTLFRRWALLYLSEDDLSILCSKIRQHASILQDISSSPGLVAFFEQVNNSMASGMMGELFTGFLTDDSRQADTTPEYLDFLVRVFESMKQYLDSSSPFVSPWTSFFSSEPGAGNLEDGRIWTEGRKYLLVSVAPKLNGDGFSKAKEGLSTLRQTIAEVKTQYPGVNAGVTGQKALDEDETESALRGMKIATFLSIAGLVVLLVIFWRGFRRPLMEMLTLLIALVFTFGLTTLVIGHLNLLSVTFAPMLLGLGIDYGVHWFARYSEEEQQKGIPRREALSNAMSKVGPTILLAGFSATLSLFPLMLTGFKGLVELGLICAMGMCVMTIATLGLLPALIILFDRSPGTTWCVSKTEKAVLPFIHFTRSNSIILSFFALIALAAGLLAAWNIRFDLNTLHLQSKNAESVIWERRLIENSKLPSIHGVVFARSIEEVASKSQAIEKLSTVSEVQSVRNLLPSNQKNKIRLLQQLRPILPATGSAPTSPAPVDTARLDNLFGRIAFKMMGSEAGESGADAKTVSQMKKIKELIEGIRNRLKSSDREAISRRLKDYEVNLTHDLNDKLDIIRAGMNAQPMTLHDLPRPLLDRFVGPDNLYLIRVLPSQNIWEPGPLSRFVSDLRSIDPDATGDPVTLSIFTRAFRDACIHAAFYAVVFIFIFLMITLRSFLLTCAALIPLILGTVWTFGLMRLFDVHLNLANVVFLPLIVGAGVEYGVVIVGRWRQERRAKSGITLPFGTAVGVILAGLTTTIGFGSLVISEHQGVKSLGLLTMIGSITVLAAAVIFLPALLHLFELICGRRIKQAAEPKDARKESTIEPKMS